METWRGRRIVPTNAAYRELHNLGISLADVVRVLEEGYAPEGRKRKQGIIEMCLRQGDEVTKVVVAESLEGWSGEIVWLVVHVMRVRI